MLDIMPSNSAPRFRFERDDEVVLGGIAYRPTGPAADGYIFQRVEGDPFPVQFDTETLAAYAARGDLAHTPGKFDPGFDLQADRKLAAGISLVDGDEGEMLNIRRAFVMGFLDVEREGLLKRTDRAIAAAMPHIQIAAQGYYDTQMPEKRGRVGAKAVVLHAPSASTLRRWLKAYENMGLSGLLDERRRRGNRQRRMTPEELAILGSEVAKYLSPQRPSIAQIHLNARDAFNSANAERALQGLPPLKVPSREAVRQEVRKIDPFHAMLAREGREKALRKFSPVGQGLTVTRPLERVEIDEWMIDLMSVMNAAGLSPLLTREEREALGLDNSKKRWWISVAICCTTRCILGMRLMREPSARSALETVEMALNDKGVFVDAVGGRTPWNMCGRIEHLVTDCGPAFKAVEFAKGIADLGIRFELAPAGLPHLRATIERVFRTFGTQLMPLLSGRTFSDVITKGEHDPTREAVLTADELATALVRYIVDIYHNSPHAGLKGETPFNCWQRLMKEHGVLPAPDRRRQRLAFGTTLTRKLQTTGVRVLNVQYHSAELAAWMAAHGPTEVEVRWHHADIGQIEVRLGDSWHMAGAVMEGFDGVSAQTWLAASRQIRATNAGAAEVAEDIVRAAIRDIEAMNANAVRRGGLLVQTWDAERLRHCEEKLFIGFKVAGSAPAAGAGMPGATPPAQQTGWGTSLLSPALPDISDPPVARTEPPLPTPKQPADDWSFDDE